MQTFLIAHANEKGTGVAQATLSAKSESEAVAAFRRQFPQREVLTVGVKGVG